MSSTNQQSQTTVPRHVQAAMASWLAPLIAIILNVAVGKNAEERSVTLAVGAIAGILVLAGLLFAIWAIIGAFKNGPLKILFPAVVGLTINGFLVFVTYSAFQFTSEIAEDRRVQEVAIATTDWIPEGTDWYIDRNTHFALRFPETWEVVPNPQPGVAVIALSPLESPEDEFRENITIVSGRIPSGLSPEAFLENELRDLRNNTVGFQEYGSGTETINDVQWLWIDYRQVAQGIESRVKGYMAVRHGHAYAVICGGEPERVNDFRADFDKVVGSLRTP